MKRHNLATLVTAVVASVAPHLSQAATSTAPIVAVGGLGSYSELEFKGHKSTSSEHMPEWGLFLSFGNKMTAQTGLVYQAEITGQYVDRQGQKVQDLQADLDLGWRAALDERNFVDVLVGGGYKWNRFDPNFNKFDINLTSRTPFAKIAAGYNHLFDTATVRLEAGVRKSIEGDSELKIHGVGSQTLDLKDTSNPYAELHLLFNQQGAVPFIAILYYNHFKYDLDGQFTVTDFDQQIRDEYGLKLGVVF